jgi:cell division protein FtsW
LPSSRCSSAGLKFQSYVAASIGIWLGLQAFVNIGVNMGLLPTKGLTLPLLSYGGSSMLVTLGWLGVLLRVHHETQQTGRAAATRTERPA